MRAVVKIGTSSLTDEAGHIRHEAVRTLCEQVARARAAGHELVIVTSGAVAAGVGALGFGIRPGDMPTLQAVAAVGQGHLMQVYNAALEHHGLIGAQVLLDPHDFIDRRQYLHARQTILRLIALGAIPIVNENDAIANEELRYGDNDRLAALVAHTVGASVLVLLTDLDGLYTADPRHDPDARLVARVAAEDPLLAIRAGGSGSVRGSGGMASKLAAARIASWSGVRTVIARASLDDVVSAALDDVAIGTTFAAHDRQLPARKLWIAFASRVSGAVVVDDGARRALVERQTSLLPAGVIEIKGAFGEDDTVDVIDTDGRILARGLVGIDADRLRQIAGRQTRDLPAGTIHEVIHRDDLVIFDVAVVADSVIGD